MQQVLAERAAEQKQEAIQNEIYLARQHVAADAERYRRAAASHTCCTCMPEYSGGDGKRLLKGHTSQTLQAGHPLLVEQSWLLQWPRRLKARGRYRGGSC